MLLYLLAQRSSKSFLIPCLYFIVWYVWTLKLYYSPFLPNQKAFCPLSSLYYHVYMQDIVSDIGHNTHFLITERTVKLSYWPFLCRLIGRFSKSPKLTSKLSRFLTLIWSHTSVCLHANIIINIWQVMQNRHTFSTNEIAGGKTWYSRDMDLERNISNIMTMQVRNINIFYNSYCENKCQDTIFYVSIIATKDIFLSKS